MEDEAKLCTPIHSPVEVLAVRHAVGHCLEKNWALSIGQCWLQALRFSVSVHLINLLSILLRFTNGFGRIQKAVRDQTSSRPSNSDHDLFSGAGLALGSALELLLSLTTELVITGCCIKSTFHCTAQPD